MQIKSNTERLVELPLCERGAGWLAEHSGGGKRIVLSTHLERKAATWANILTGYGNQVYFVPSNKDSTRTDAHSFLQSINIPIGTPLDIATGASEETLKELEAFEPDVILDDGGLLIRAVSEDYKRYPSLQGCVEFTTSGINELQHNLKWPIADIAHSFCKYRIGNPLGTGESTLSTIMSLTNISISGLRVGVIGYGSVGKGIATTARKLGATVFVSDITLRRRATAYFDGMLVCELPELIRNSELIITSTGAVGTITRDMFADLRKVSYLANVGCFRSELPLEELKEDAHSIVELRPGITTYQLGEDKNLHVLANGELVNLAYGAGWPIKYIDLAFCLTTLCFQWVTSLNEPGIVAVPSELEDQVLTWLLEGGSL